MLSQREGREAPWFNTGVVDWARIRDSRFDVDRVPALLAQLERRDDADAWRELGWRLVLEDDLVSPAGFVALPQLVHLAPRSAHARALAGRILERAAVQHGCDDLLADCAGTITEFGETLDRHLRSRPADYLVSYRALLAVAQEYHWANALEGFTDDIYELECPHCGAAMKIAVGRFGCYSQVWDGDEELRGALRPAVAEALTGTGRWMHRIAVRDGQEALADGIAHLFGEAQCPLCASVFNIADEYTHANRPAAFIDRFPSSAQNTGARASPSHPAGAVGTGPYAAPGTKPRRQGP
ncbi:hypothetical protein [Streptomyces sp. CBMA123]|uniref:hypothetical protein n=1 Tax=Streptomyces sp. CBMA123 TaxID=1896313 RepID=UPI001661B99A|nr:hypothetical protein [Streptomyces sp. CBMA123]